MSVTIERHGRYDLKAMKMKDTALARAFIHGVAGAGIVAEAKGKTVDDAMEALKAAVAEVEEERTAARRHIDATGFDVPTAAEFERALGAAKISDRHWDMLHAHAAAGDDGLSAEGLAKAAGYKSQTAANTQYGKLGEAIAGAVGVELPRSTMHADAAVATGVLASPGEQRDGNFVWVMHPELREALSQ